MDRRFATTTENMKIATARPFDYAPCDLAQGKQGGHRNDGSLVLLEVRHSHLDELACVLGNLIQLGYKAVQLIG